MKVTLTKDIELRSAQVYLRFQKKEDRKDIQEYLSGKKQFDSLIEIRIKDYLKNIGIFDENHQLTKYGNNVKESGKMLVSEEGKYQIWYTQNDSFFGSKILYFKRLQPSNSKNDELISLKIAFNSQKHFLLPTDTNIFTEIFLNKSEGFSGKEFSGADKLHFSWVWQNLEVSHYYFQGQIERDGKKTQIKNTAISSDIDIQRKISEILQDWNNEYKRYSIRFDYLSDEMKRTFEDKNFTSKWNNFEVQIQNLPLMPYNKEEAKKWRNWLLNEELKKEYFSISDFEATATEINEKEALAAFSLDIPKIKDFVEKTDSKKVFWHLNAPMDLNPNTKIKISSKQQHIELKQGDKVSFADIIAKLGFDNSSTFVYYDRFVVNEKQQKAVSALTKAVNSLKKIVITDLTPKENSSDFIQKNVKEITLRDCKSIFKAKSPHDRYLIASNQNGMSIWNVSNSISYIAFSDRNINETTVGTIQQSVVFTPISKEILDKDLLNFIHNETNYGN